MDTIRLDQHKGESSSASAMPMGRSPIDGGRPPAQVLPEAGTESEWVARHLESLGHRVVVADPNYAPMYATRSRRIKTDKRDARTLMEVCRLGVRGVA